MLRVGGRLFLVGFHREGREVLGWFGMGGVWAAGRSRMVKRKCWMSVVVWRMHGEM